MRIPFVEMHGAGNDFVVVDDRALTFPAGEAAFIQRIAARRTGLGCEGILLLQPSDTADFRMRFINPDGGEQSMCGNGARCIARFAFDRGIAGSPMAIGTGAGRVAAEVRGEQVCLELTEPTDLALDIPLGLAWPVDFVNTGVPHAVAWVDAPASTDVAEAGRAIRRHPFFAPAGTNADFVRVEADGTLSIRTYERGVEAETPACGTGAAAAAVCAVARGRARFPVTVHCAGGQDLVINRVRERITLTGGAAYVFAGEVEYGNRL